MKKLRTFLIFLLLLFGLLIANPVSVQADTNANTERVVIADSDSEFSATQGKDNWYYGYKEDQLLAPFEEMNIYDDKNQVWQVKSGTYKTSLFAKGGVPNAIEPSGNNLAAKQFAVRRWLSEVDGDITVSGVLKSKSVEQGGDGVKGYILVNGQRVWSGPAKDGQPVGYRVTAKVKQGDPVDLVISSRRNDAFDDTEFIAQILGTPSAINPDAIAKGTWETVPLPDDKKDWMQAVATVLLPNGKILIANGSANRNTLVFENGQAKFLDGVNSSDYDTVNNTLLFDPTTNKFERIDSPPAVLEGDSNDLYPRVFPSADGRILITGDGAGKFPLQIHASKKSYLMTINEDSNGNITSETIKFDITPERGQLSKVYGTGLLDPNRSGDTLLIGGLLGTNDLNMGRPFDPAPDPSDPNNPRIARSLEHWISPEHSGTQNGKWEIFEDFLAQPRAMNMAVILPTKEILVINGGEYGEYKPTYEPTLTSFDPNAKGSYKTTKMNPSKLPRLYHNNALLLPDARVLNIGGNNSRAGRQKDGTVRIDVIPNPPKNAGFKTGYYQIAELVDKEGNDKTFDVKEYLENPQDFFAKQDFEAYKAGNLKELLPFVPAEIRQAEIFSPPYLFKPGARPEIIRASATLKYGQADNISVKDATQNGSLVLVGLGSTTHSLDYGQRLAEAKITTVALGAESLVSFTAPENANLYPPGYYMMFYVNDIGKPSEAKMVKLEA